jgi:hypothetical protein
MSVFHYKGHLLSVEDSVARYRFYPDFIAASEVFGEFVVDTTSWDHSITVPAGAEEKGLVSMDSHCVASLVGKLRDAGKELAEVRWIA